MNQQRRRALGALTHTLGIGKIDLQLLDMALTHPSYAMEHQLEGDNQRLEFLGDAVVDLLMGEYLYRAFPNDDEGKLTKMRASLVCEEALAEAARKLGLSAYLLLGRGEEATGGATRPSNLADAWEAMCGAIYLSCGAEVLKPVLETYLDHAITMVKGGYYGDYKTRLQEYIQQEPNHTITYELLEERGPAHDRDFYVEVCVDGKSCGRGWGKSKKLAQREAALQALIAFGELPQLENER
ncbi:MAG: ribonuclease III [Peptococcaceae bacterium]|nr:ribonuclease III [Peptococcaceae bacterium]